MEDRGHITGSVTKKAGRYYAVIYYYDAGGKRRSVTRATGIAVDEGNKRRAAQAEREARKALQEALRTFQIPDKRPDAGTSFSDYARLWLSRKRSQVEESTYAGYLYVVADICEFFDKHPKSVRDIDESAIEEYVCWERTRRQPDYIPAKGEEKKRTKSADGSGINNTVHHRVTAIKSILQMAKRDGLIQRNPASSRESWFKSPKVQKYAFSVFTVEEARKMLDKLICEPLWFVVAVMLAIELGLRRSEIIGLRESDIDFACGRVTIRNVITQQTVAGRDTIVSKTHTKAEVLKGFQLSPRLLCMIKQLIEQHRENSFSYGAAYCEDWANYIFRDADGRLIRPNRLTARYDAFLQKNGMKRIRLHDLRHTCASLLYEEGVSAKVIQETLGHKQLSTTMETYTHLFGHEKHEAVAALSAKLWEGRQVDGNFDGKE